MLEAIKAIPETIENWRDNRDLLFDLVTGVSAALVVTSLVGEKRPSDSIAALAHGLGVTPVANWFSTNAPPVLTESSSTAQTITSLALMLLVAGMVLVPVWRDRHDNTQMFSYGPLRLLGSPAASTVWILLLISTQQSDIASTARRWESMAVSVAVLTLAGFFVSGALSLIADRCGFGEAVKVMLRSMAVLAFRVGFGFGATILSIALAAISLPLATISWMSALESSDSREVRNESERQLAERAPQPTGAAVVTIRPT